MFVEMTNCVAVLLRANAHRSGLPHHTQNPLRRWVGLSANIGVVAQGYAQPKEDLTFDSISAQAGNRGCRNPVRQIFCFVSIDGCAKPRVETDRTLRSPH